MRIFHGFDNLAPISKPIVTIGSYDGVHHGHREILSHVCKLARQHSGESVVITFHPHPRLVLHKDQTLRQLNTLPEKLELLAQVGIDNVLIIPFTEAFSRLQAEEFVHDYLVQKLHIDTLEIGYDHHLGYGQQGDFNALEKFAERYGFRLQQIPQQRVDDHKVSSTIIRQLIASGHLTEAARYLDTYYPLSGYLNHNGLLTGVERVKLLPPPGAYPCLLYPHFIPQSESNFNEVTSDGRWNPLNHSQAAQYNSICHALNYSSNKTAESLSTHTSLTIDQDGNLSIPKDKLSEIWAKIRSWYLDKTEAEAPMNRCNSDFAKLHFAVRIEFV